MKKTTLALIIGSLLSPQVFAMNDDWSSSSSDDAPNDFMMKTYMDFEPVQFMPDIWQSEDTPAWKTVTMKHSLNHMLATPSLQVGQQSVLSTEFISDGGYVSFDVVFRGQKGNIIEFYVNDQLMIDYDETIKQYQLRFPLPAKGQRVKLKWVYKKNLESLDFIDRIRIDNLTISGQMDSDLDGFNDAWELKYFNNLDTVSLETAAEDVDQDGLSYRQEYMYHTHPQQADTDQDGWNDAKELIMGTPPMSANKEAIDQYQIGEAPLALELALSLKEDGFVKEALSILNTLANEREYAPAMRTLGLMYLKDKDMQQNVMVGIEWLRKAAQQEHAAAQFDLYRALKTAPYVQTAGDEKPFIWLERAAHNGHHSAYYPLAEAYREGDGVQQDEFQAIEWYKKATENATQVEQNTHVAASLQRLGELYQAGLGVQHDQKQADEYFLAAFKAGYRAPAVDQPSQAAAIAAVNGNPDA